MIHNFDLNNAIKTLYSTPYKFAKAFNLDSSLVHYWSKKKWHELTYKTKVRVFMMFLPDVTELDAGDYKGVETENDLFNITFDINIVEEVVYECSATYDQPEENDVKTHVGIENIILHDIINDIEIKCNDTLNVIYNYLIGMYL